MGQANRSHTDTTQQSRRTFYERGRKIAELGMGSEMSREERGRDVFVDDDDDASGLRWREKVSQRRKSEHLSIKVNQF